MDIKKINVYKIKNNVKDFSDFIKTQDSKKNTLPELKNLTLPLMAGFTGTAIAKAAFKPTGGNEKTDNNIPWLSFINQAKPGGGKFDFSWTNKFPSAVVAIKITVDGVSSFYALTFGMAGDSFLDHDMVVHDFGIKVAMNICDENKLKRVQTSAHEAVSTQTERQISSNSDFSTFNINGEKEFLRMLSGTASSEYGYISSFKGKENISLKLDKEDPMTWQSLIPRLHGLGQVSQSTRYQNIFTEYDKFPFESDPAVIEELDNILFTKIRDGKYSNIHLSPPEFFDYDSLMFSYDPEDDRNRYDELILTDLLAQRKRKFKETADINSIKKMRISVYNAETEAIVRNKWSAYDCLVAEIERQNETYILSIGQWRKVSASLQQEVSDFITPLVISKPTYLPDNISIWNPHAKGGKNGKSYIGENQEAVFNKKAEEESADLFLFDKGKIKIAGEKKYEVCDLFHKDKKFIQVKRYSSGSASISHLFVQARFYAEAFLFDSKCRSSMCAHINDKANGRDVSSFVSCLPEDRTAISAEEYYICLCLLTDKANLKISELPFMSKYELMHTLKYLTNLGFRHEIIVKEVIFGKASQPNENQDEEENA